MIGLKVRYKGKDSITKEISIGVPQGSILGPLPLHFTLMTCINLYKHFSLYSLLMIQLFIVTTLM